MCTILRSYVCSKQNIYCKVLLYFRPVKTFTMTVFVSKNAHQCKGTIQLNTNGKEIRMESMHMELPV